jgi:hypothetical protein
MELLPGNSSKPLVCGLTSVALDERRRYEALSYTWGHSPERFYLYLEEDSDGPDDPKQFLEITGGLYQALAQLRRETELRIL